MPYLYLDTETYSATPIKRGTYRYTADCELLLVQWALDDDPVEFAEGSIPEVLRALLKNPSITVVAHNTMFDRHVLDYACNVYVPVSRWHDTAVQALAHSLPPSLAELSVVMGLPADKAKDKDGKRLINLFCKPATDGTRYDKYSHPEDWDKFIAYGVTDIHAMREVHKRLPTWNSSKHERGLWELDQLINDRGILIDAALAKAAVEAVAQRKEGLRAEMATHTDNKVSSATERDTILAHLADTYGEALPDLKKSTVEEFILDPLMDDTLREILRNRLEGASNSTAKYTALLRSVSDDGRVRGLLQFCGAARTGRWAGRVFQPQNLPRPTISKEGIAVGIDAFVAGCSDVLGLDIQATAVSALRGCLLPTRGKKLVVSDLANIEGRAQAHLAGETWKIQAFKDFDTILGYDNKGKAIRKGPDLYKLAYANSFGVHAEDVDDFQRSIGKVQELALGYAGGVGAFAAFAAGYGIDLDEMARRALPGISPAIMEESRSFHEWMIKKGNDTYGMSPDTFTVCNSFKTMWRRAHPAIAGMWAELDNVTRHAVSSPGTVLDARGVKVKSTGAWLLIRLPSGRFLSYPSPRVSDDGQLSYMGMHNKKWIRINTFGGKFFENICQAFARDIMAYNMPAIELAGYEILLTVHDEVVTETPDTSEFTHDELGRMLADVPPWCAGIPLAASGAELKRYGKA